MHLSELTAAAAALDRHAPGSLVETVYRACGGTLIALYGAVAPVRGIFFSTDARLLFPAIDIAPFPRETITNREESLRKYLGGARFLSATTDPARGRVIFLNFAGRTLVVPLFGGRPIFLRDDAGTILWREPGDIDLSALAAPLAEREPRFADPLAWQEHFLAEQAARRAEERERRIEKEKRALRERIARMRAEREKATERAAGNRAHGELIKAWIYTLPAQERRPAVTLTGADGEEKTLPLDPERTIAENMNDLFAEAKRIQRGLAVLERRITETEQAIVLLDRDAPEPPPALRAPVRRRAAADAGRHIPYRRFRAPSGRLFLVGKSSADNDELTFKISSPHDLWFHAQGQAGSHVVLRKKKGEVATEEELFLGCCLALYYSKARGGMEGEVWYAERKLVRKKKGMAPGMVLITQGRSKYIRADEGFFRKLVREDGA